MTDHAEKRWIRDGHARDWPAVRLLLTSAGLPVADLNAARLNRFQVEISSNGKVEKIEGAVALETYDRVGLLRSLVVDASARAAGCGSRLVQAIEKKAIAMGIGELWLLTIDAEGFFASRGYRTVSRDETPLAIRGTAEFSSLCPDSAYLMKKSLR